ncbi:MAG: hypothetical protein AAGB34_02270, partial [Planctomycetota bacterium]
MDHQRLAGWFSLFILQSLALAAVTVLPAVSAFATPMVIEAQWELEGRGTKADLALTGPASIETRSIAQGTLRFYARFDQPIFSIGPVECQGGIINELDFVPGESSASISVTPSGSLGYVIVSMQSVFGASGVLGEATLALAILPGDSNSSRSIDVTEILSLMDLIGSSDAQSDLDGSGTTDIFDLITVLESADRNLPVLPPLLGKIDGFLINAGAWSPAIIF